ncbi:MAG: outer membrane beta-barrel protein [Prevotella sp.]|uniref:outer membrane beta-barrel protein n=1 Tax=Prevotella sp. PTAC TaxID=2736295 RepID=UPI001555566C|nr:outer membrane beta-barrel protein [Prevotella sp. PTAC]MCX4292641.1 outer membrane beta-barrel protein [Prevotella sp.]NPD54289.1 outer membrane beta-barrel protein [Prevotella sp. PTAC]
MKKLFLMAAFVVASVAASAQIYVGGSLGFESSKENKDADALTSFSILPEVGYNLSDNLAVGIQLGYASQEQGDEYTVSAFSVAPYARYTFAKSGAASFFVDGGIIFTAYGSDAEGSNFGVGLRPGVKFAVSDKVDVVAKTGFLGYSKNSEKFNGGGSAFGLSIDNTDLTLGILFNF